MILEVRAVPPFEKNGFVVGCERTREAVIIDPGDEADQLVAAVRDFEEFLRRAPDHPQAELARYKLVLAAVETGALELALARARIYLHRHPDGQFVGRLLQRFPELKDEL